MWQTSGSSDVEADHLMVSSGFLGLYVVFLLCHLLGYFIQRPSFCFVYEMTVGVISINDKPQNPTHEKTLNDL